jgi:hypothetical protein
MLFFPTTDEDFQYFRAQGYTGSINDMHLAALGDLGYTGTITDRTYAYLMGTYGSYHEAMRNFRDGTSVFAFLPALLFGSGEQGVIFDPSVVASLSQDSAGTTPVTAAGQPVGRMLDLSGNGNHATQATAGKRPTYQTDGTLHWLVFNGTSSAMVTPSIDFTATDEMSVFAGMRKLSDAATAILAELSTAAGFNAGSFYLLGSVTTGAYQGRTAGTLQPTVDSAVYSAPKTAVLSLLGDISLDSLAIRVNQAETSSSGDQGTGNFGNFPLYIGARNQTSLYFNGNLYGLTVRGALSDGTTLSKSESLMAAKTGVVF